MTATNPPPSVAAFAHPTSATAGSALNDKYPEAYNLMIGFYCDPKYYNSRPDCRPADNVLMAIQYALDAERSTARKALAAPDDITCAGSEGAREAYERGIWAATVWLRDQQHERPPATLWSAAAILADRMNAALLPARSEPVVDGAERHVAECNVFEGGRCNCVDGPHPVVDGNDEQPGDYLRDRLRNIANICEAKGLLIEASGLRDTASIISGQLRKAFGQREAV